ncbi:MAG: hypothetical protein ABS79_01580 [Planctomycetes bacterium SCN 63-9]|nr:MAG: hypothetical protein ABS79_01580 [Planctomycetes bacterium SCN 63-9]
MTRRKDVPKPKRLFNPRMERLEVREVLTTPTLLAAPATKAASIASALASLDPSNGTPTRREQMRQTFTARFKGDFTTGPGRFTDQSSQTYMFGGGNSNMFLHADLQLGYFSYKDVAQPATGLAALIVKDVGNTGNELDLNLVGDPSSVDRHGRITRFTWTVADSSGGTFTGAIGEGTLRLIYMPGGKFTKRAFGGGTAGAIFKGSVYTNGVTNILRT